MSGKGEDLSYSEAIELAHESITRFPLIPVQGVPLMSLIANDWDNVWAFRPDPADILIATYPKAGTDRRSSSSCTQNSSIVHTIYLVVLFAGVVAEQYVSKDVLTVSICSYNNQDFVIWEMLPSKKIY